ncbi:MAG: hypothetical protein WC548_02040 [Candidatus Pacearchaeota archaeon]
MSKKVKPTIPEYHMKTGYVTGKRKSEDVNKISVNEIGPDKKYSRQQLFGKDFLVNNKDINRAKKHDGSKDFDWTSVETYRIEYDGKVYQEAVRETRPAIIESLVDFILFH